MFYGEGVVPNENGTRSRIETRKGESGPQSPRAPRIHRIHTILQRALYGPSVGTTKASHQPGHERNTYARSRSTPTAWMRRQRAWAKRRLSPRFMFSITSNRKRHRTAQRVVWSGQCESKPRRWFAARRQGAHGNVPIKNNSRADTATSTPNPSAHANRARTDEGPGSNKHGSPWPSKEVPPNTRKRRRRRLGNREREAQPRTRLDHSFDSHARGTMTASHRDARRTNRDQSVHPEDDADDQDAQS